MVFGGNYLDYGALPLPLKPEKVRYWDHCGDILLLGIGYLYALTGSLNMADVAVRLNDIGHSGTFAVAITFIVVGLSIKAALFPPHGWLPDAYTHAPAPVIGFISAVMAEVSAYALFRVLYFVHAIMKACLFLVAGGVQWRTGGYRLEDFKGMSRRMPLTMAAMVLAAISMIGLPPTAGFFSKANGIS